MGSPEPGAESWREEAEAVIADIRDHVESVSVSTQLHSSCKKIYINLTTLEKKEYCIELTGHGFRVVGNRHDSTEMEQGEVFETPYSLLDSLSPGYRNSFGKALEMKLSCLDDELKDGQ